MHKASQHMQNTMAQHQQRKKKSPGTISSTARAKRTGIDDKADTRNRRARLSQLFSAREAPFAQKTMFGANPNIQIASTMQQFQCDLPRMTCENNENRKTVLQSSYLSTSFDAAIPLRSADTELQHTVGLQHATVEHIAWMQQFQCTKPLNTCKHNSTASTKKRKGHLEPSVPLRAQNEQESTAKRTPASVARTWANFSPQRKLRLPQKKACTTQFQCDLPRMTCKTQWESQDSTAEQLPFDQRWCNHSTAVCRHWVATHRRIATRYCRTHCLDAAVPMHKASQHMQNTIEQRQQRKEEVTWNNQFHCARKTNRNRRQSGRPQASRALEPTLLRNGSSVYQKKSFVQIPRYKSHPWCSSSNAICPRMVCKTQWESQDSTAEQLPFDQRWRNHSTAVCRHWVATHHRIATHQRIATRYCRTHCLDAAVAMHKAFQHMKNTIAQHQQRKEKVTWNNQFHCARKTNRNRRQSGRPQASRARVSQLFSATEAPFTPKKSLHNAVPMRSAKNDLQNTMRIARQYCRAATFRPALMQPFHCGLQTLSCNTP